MLSEGAEDQLFDAQTEAEAFDAVPGSRVEVMDGVGHSPQVEDPEATAELILPFSAAGDAVEVPAAPKIEKPKAGKKKPKAGAGEK